MANIVNNQAAASPRVPPPAIELVGIDKSFGAVHANRDVSIAVAKGEVHGIIGENGAGKSTLMSILYGFYEADRGEIRVNGKPASIRNSADAIAADHPLRMREERPHERFVPFMEDEQHRQPFFDQ